MYGCSYRTIQGLNLQSQSKLFGHLTVFLPSQCCCARFDELTAIKNIGRERRRARRKKKNSVRGIVPTIFI